MTKTLAILATAILVVIIPATQGQSNLCKTTTILDHNKCAAAQGQYKCAVFYKDVPRKNDPSKKRLAWIGGLPDALRKVKVQKSPEIRATFGNVKPQSFWFSKENEKDLVECTDVAKTRETASSRCYVAMDNPATRPLDSCEVNILNEEGDLTLGDLLCQNIKDSGWIPQAQQSIDNQIIGFYYSVCNKSGERRAWRPISAGDKNLEASEPLCCHDVDGKFRFKRCSGEPYDSSDKCKS